MTIRPFETLSRLRQRMAEAVIAQSGLRHSALTAHLRETLPNPHHEGALIPPPVLEGAFPFVTADETLAALSGRLLDERTVAALAGDNSGEGYSFPQKRFPYQHQLEAWRVLGDPKPRSAIISAGTGSGKTECFFVPMLDSLYRRRARVSGVEAIMLYPLNALIASQQERLDAWTKPANGAIRYCLYNGNLREKLKANEQREALSRAPQNVPDRQALRRDPPPLLVTNLTMLEYMLVRPQDRPILEASRGRLKWIVLDEAHTLVGSAAAEVALLLRRVMEAFEVDPTTVRFVATSATIGQGADVEDKLRRFLANIGGIQLDQVTMITGHRRLPRRPGTGGVAPKVAELGTMSPQALFDALGSHNPVWSLVEGLKDRSVPAAELERLAGAIGVNGETLAMALARAQNANGETLAPLRVHSFHRASPGLWSCTNPDCPAKMGEGWSAGRILYEREETCPSCRMPVAELFTCNECGEAFMIAEEKGDRLTPPRNLPPSDEFLFEAIREVEDDGEFEAIEEVSALDMPSVRHCFSLQDAGLLPLFIDKATGRSADSGGEGRYRLTSHGDGTGPCPSCSARNKSGDKLYPFRFGAPFIIGNAAPMLLAAMPPADKVVVPLLPQTPPDLPASGRQLISFTDSRQGTARMAARLQIESERAFVRSFIYQAVQLKAAGDGETEKTIELRGNIARVKDREGWQDDALFASLVAGWEKELAQQSGDVTISWPDLRASLADRIEIREWLPQVWGDRADIFKASGSSPASQLANALLLRELLRRPRMANTPETMGLARLLYPTVERIVDAPRGFLQRGATLEDWKAWLGSILVFAVRSPFAVAVSRDLLRWIARKGFPKKLSSPGLEPARRQQAWPRASTSAKIPQVVELLRLGLGLNPGSKEDRIEMNDWLEKAWNQLLPLFPANESGERALDFDLLQIAPLKNAFLCPITRRIVDVAPFGLTPYAHIARDRAEPVTLPSCPVDGDEAIRRAFTENDTTVAKLRARGLWTDLHDRIALFSPYARSAEHSAQLSPARLRRYEARFKAGEINFLNCSTTMEMGVDIGSVNGVMMTNVPPSIANYRQRVGRAGRRGQPLSLAFTFAKDRPLDREAFRDPAAYLKREIAAPRVALDSRPIVLRHVGAFFLGRFLEANSGNALKMAAGDFFGCPEVPRAARALKAERPVARFLDWLGLATTANDSEAALHRLVRGTVLDGRQDLAELTAEAMAGVESEFADEWRALQEQLPGATEIGAAKSLELHLKRLCGEFLLSDLADRGFLPGHGFPNNIVSFELGGSLPDEDVPDGRIGQRHGGPKRPLDIAIRDYAPGSETVVDGQVYRVGGVTLNWHRPSSEQGVREIQALRWATRCAHCGDSWTGAGSWPEQCRTCADAAIKVDHYLKPAGFLRDSHVETHADIDQVAYVRPEPPRISAGSARWEALTKPTAGRLRLNRRGTVYYHTKGPGSQPSGYGLCLYCGRMEPMKLGEMVCSGLDDHKPLRSPENFMEPCEGNEKPFTIKTGLHLGYEIHTDVLELQPAATPDIGAANALAIAMREALARHLGIEPDEMGYGIGASRNAMTSTTLSIFLYDRAAGGAGYVVRAADDIRAILKSARAILDCPRKCTHACSSCVLVSDAPEKEEELDRKKAITFMDAHLCLPDMISPEDAFAQRADISGRPLAEIDEWLNGRGQSKLFFWAQLRDLAALEDWPPTSLFRRWAGNGRAVTLILPRGTVDALDASQLLYLRDYSSRHHVIIAEGDAVRFSNGGILFAYATDGQGGHAWASRDDAIQMVAPDWGASHSLPIARAPLELEPRLATVSPERLAPKSGAAVVILDRTLDGPISAFGEKMSKAIRKAAADCGVSAKERPVQVSYRDRFARSPLVLRLLVDTVSVLTGGETIPLSIETASDKDSGFSRNQVASDITDNDMLDAFAGAYGDRRNLDVKLTVGQPPHKRSLILVYESGRKLIVDLDQGFGWLLYEGLDRSFDAGAAPQVAASRIANLSGRLRRRHDHDSQMVVWRS
ncbi:DEAD/DEAH box helicase [Mesorhizobium sp. B2-3-15]|uniref:DEAD/DEAH box helicase n=1 Tax=Mesorhizobium sp. B2-3-15 TaxID=2589949 RepID=UPI00112869E1|nr:DEAD/DEAH box helicase [Mesorhizobium sp. B2-3-15]TPL71382.1 DEAD/DEAH box helicase [Mesorhizobium sp. B2-3-15]